MGYLYCTNFEFWLETGLFQLTTGQWVWESSDSVYADDGFGNLIAAARG